MAEFKKLSDVEVVAEPAESANVLIEEDGVIKKAPKTAVGGNGEWDAVIHLEGGWSMDSVESFTLIEGTYAKVQEKIQAKEMPKISIYWHYQYGDYSDILTQPCSVIYFPIESENIIIYFRTGGGTEADMLYLYPDNTVGVPEPV